MLIHNLKYGICLVLLFIFFCEIAEFSAPFYLIKCLILGENCEILALFAKYNVFLTAQYMQKKSEPKPARSSFVQS